MKIVAKYSFNNAEKVIQNKYSRLFCEVDQAVRSVKPQRHKTKMDTGKVVLEKLLYCHKAINADLKMCFHRYGWINHKEKCEYSDKFYIDEYKPAQTENVFREIDCVKERLCVEVHFERDEFLVYSGCAKMTIFKNLGHIDTGIEIVPVKALADEMSSGVSYFEQFVWDLEQRGTSNIDVPVLVLGIDV